MFSRKVKFVLLFLIAGLLSACASQGAQTPASEPTEKVVSVMSSVQGTETPATVPSSATAGSSSTAGNTPAATVSFSKDVTPIIDSRCVNCHGGNRMEEGLSLKTYKDILSGSKNGAVVVPGDAGNSLLAELVANQKMPKRGPKLTPPQVQLIMDWINQGALNN